MKTRLFVSLLSASAVLVGASISFAQNNTSAAQQATAKYSGRPNEMAKAP
jgi:mono/diheme cytochrome c family protein